MLRDDHQQAAINRAVNDDAQQRFDAWIDGNAGDLTRDVPEDLAEMKWLRDMIVSEARLREDSVSSATFAGVWTKALAQIEEQRPAVATAGSTPSWLTTLRQLFTPQRLSWSLAGACAALAIGVLAWPESPNSATIRNELSVQAPALPTRLAAEVKTSLDPVPANFAKPPSEAPLAANSGEILAEQRAEAQVERIDFGGRSGRISQIDSARGVTTVIWLSESDEKIPPKVQDL